MTEPQKGAVSLSGVSRSYGSVQAARDVSLDVRPGEFLTLLGPSGCGKTTLLRMIAGFETPDRRPVNTVFQHYALFPHRTVAGNVAFGLETAGRDDVPGRVAGVDAARASRFWCRGKPFFVSSPDRARVMARSRDEAHCTRGTFGAP